MQPAFSPICPTCKANISDSDQACLQCGADVSVWPGVGRTPLILPGNPALSEDEVRRRISPARILGGTAVGIAALFGALYLTSANEPEEPALLYATGTTGLPAEPADGPPSATVTPLAGAVAVSPPPASNTVTASAPTPVGIDVPTEPALEPIPTFVPSASTPLPAPPTPAAAPVTQATIARPQPAVPPAVRPTPRAAQPGPSPAPRVLAAAPRATMPAPAGKTTLVAAPVLKLTPLVSDSLRPGELLQLRWSVQDRATGRALPADMEFTSTDASVASVDRRTGTVSARKPGRVRIIVDAGGGRDTSVALIVRPQASVAVAAAATSEPLQARSEAARSTASLATSPTPTTPTPTPTPPAPTPVGPTPTATAPTSATAPARDARRDEAPNDADIRAAVERVVNDVRRSGARNAQIMEFLADGDGHRVAVIGTPASSNTGNNTVRVTFDVRLTKFDGGGRPVARVVPVSLTIDKRESAVTSSAISIGALRRP